MITAHFFDGHDARLQPVGLDVRNDHLHVDAPGFARSYPLTDVALAEPFEQAPLVLRLGDATCEVPYGPGRQALLAALGYRKSAVERWQARWPAALAALVLLLALLGAGFVWGVPAAAGFIAARLPASVDIKLGRAALAGLEAQGMLAPSRLSDDRIADVEALLPRALPAHPRVPVRLLVRSSDALGANALALPDGTIIVTDKMVRLALDKRNELDDIGQAELLGVIGHEVGHIERRHATRAMTGSSLTAALSATLFGDFSAVAAGLPAVLTQMQYSRAMELEADDYAIDVLRRNGREPDDLADILEALERQHPGEGDVPRWLRRSMAYLSTHPDTAERIERLYKAGP
ncbi:M48 family metallopeptidase [Telluria mixta]|uniref:M48 family metallopeptidase n=1 Tax=Telluria mixta TaxID=34071 RepID=A0ABT2C6U4_9BURK|nr:M48 family metallopeptidase [Telluria mixta]MCS0632536.1 M48 family metallopeptidase [Telluria mixta]WEM99169.1 M48 family metallopeptidase [Telluria mixta]